MTTSPGDDSIPSLITLIITTSPTLSAPSIELLSTVLKSFRRHCAQLLDCKVVVVFDGCEQITSHPRLKKGYVTPKGAEHYETYKKNVKNLFLEEYLQGKSIGKLTETHGEAEYGSPHKVKPVPFVTTSTEDGRINFIEVTAQRLGFGLAVRTAIRSVNTPYIWVHQHDWALKYDIPITSLLDVMQASEADDAKPIKYVCLPSGRRTSYATSDQVMPFPELRKLASALTGDYVSPSDSSVVVPLTPMFFWHDKPHIASRAHYLQRVFPTRLAMMRGAFIEDTIGQRARNQMKEGQWAKWATWLYHPEGGKEVCLKHLHGRTWRGEEEEMRKRMTYRERNMASADGNGGNNGDEFRRIDDLDVEIYPALSGDET
ncbi:alcohol dehydrogenase [Pochonia chlamydosporia 170]|uniref:Alcohol dehydrogenase n=1 Tax=Pochonia chlamydosporia 170 TaxID=1380566 RepID=A0A179FMJ5_METCM|nr:alcohol dehydrogenase [Pochonia chlamydosporia 170]OAQ66794.1 alcohol dehydrogenase [Pochonia chlamydosporia 170]